MEPGSHSLADPCNFSLPNGSRRNPKSLVLLLVDARGDLGAHEHEVGPRVDGVRDEVLVLGLDLLGVLEDVLGVLLPDAAVHVVHLDLLQLLEGLELDQEDDRVDLILMEPLHILQVDGEHAVLVLLGNDIIDMFLFLGTIKLLL